MKASWILQSSLSYLLKSVLVSRMKSHFNQIQHIFSRTGKNMSCQMSHQVWEKNLHSSRLCLFSINEFK